MAKIYLEKLFGDKLFDNYLRLKKWALKGGLAVLDQAVFSGANFLSSILLARWLSSINFGEFAIGLAILTFFMQVYTSFALEPMSVLGPSGYHDHLPSYLMGQVWLLILILVPLSALLGVLVLVSQLFIAISDNSLMILLVEKRRIVARPMGSKTR